MTPVEIRDAVVARVAASLATINSGWASTDVAWPNRDFDSTDKSSFLRITIKFGDTFEGEKSSDGVDIRFGVLFLDVFVLKGSGERVALTYAGGAETILRKKNIGGVLFGEVTTDSIGPESDTPFYHVQVRAPFNTFVGE